MNKNLVLVFCLLLVGSCARTFDYVPAEYTTSDSGVEGLQISGYVEVSSEQPESSCKTQQISTLETFHPKHWYTKFYLNGNLCSIARQLSWNLQSLIKYENTYTSSQLKSIRVRIVRFGFEGAEYGYELGNGNGGIVGISAREARSEWGWGGRLGELNANLYLGAIKILKQDNVISYLAE